MKEAEYYIGEAFLQGHGVDVDVDKALHYLERSAEQGFTKAQLLLGILFLHGRKGIHKDVMEAKRYSTLL